MVPTTMWTKITYKKTSCSKHVGFFVSLLVLEAVPSSFKLVLHGFCKAHCNLCPWNFSQRICCWLPMSTHDLRQISMRISRVPMTSPLSSLVWYVMLAQLWSNLGFRCHNPQIMNIEPCPRDVVCRVQICVYNKHLCVSHSKNTWTF